MAEETPGVEQQEAALVRRAVAETLDLDIMEPPGFLGGGSVNRVFAVRAGGRDLVVRICEPWRGLSHYRTEAWCLQRAMAVGVPGPTVLGVGRLGPTPYMIQTRVTGVCGDRAPAEEQARLWRELGRYARRIHSLEVSGFGDHLTDAQRGVFGDAHSPTWLDFVDYNLNSLAPADDLLRLGVYTAEQRPQIEGVFRALRKLPFRLGLCHNDLDPRNTILGPAGEISLLDWGSAAVHIVPHCDLIAILRSYRPEDKCVRAFLRGYGLSPRIFQALLPQIRRLQLIQSFDLVRWAIDRRPEELPRCVANAQGALLAVPDLDQPRSPTA